MDTCTMLSWWIKGPLLAIVVAAVIAVLAVAWAMWRDGSRPWQL